MNPTPTRWRITIELELDSPDVRIGGAPVTEAFIRERTENHFRQALKNEPHSWWRYRKSKIAKVEAVRP